MLCGPACLAWAIAWQAGPACLAWAIAWQAGSTPAPGTF